MIKALSKPGIEDFLNSLYSRLVLMLLLSFLLSIIEDFKDNFLQFKYVTYSSVIAKTVMF